jgi:hypothetical protein
VAIHEAGHAIIAALTDDLLFVEMEDTPYGWGGYFIPKREAPDLAELLAGTAACNAVGLDQEGRDVVDLRQTHESRLGLSDRENALVLEKLVEFFESPRGRRMLDRVARELSQRRELSGEDVKRLIRKV